jgi:hypothetical protein
MTRHERREPLPAELADAPGIQEGRRRRPAAATAGGVTHRTASPDYGVQRPASQPANAPFRKIGRLLGVDSDIERPVSATSRYGRSPVRLADMKDALPLSVVARHSKFDVLGSRFLVLALRTSNEESRAWNETPAATQKGRRGPAQSATRAYERQTTSANTPLWSESSCSLEK